MITSPNLGLLIWNLGSDPYNHEELAENWAKVDQHDHTPGKGARIGTAAIADAAITPSKVAPGVITSLSLTAGQVTNDKIANNAVDASKIADGSVTLAKLAGGLALPTGALINWSGTAAPTGWLMCDGAVVSQTTYAALFAITGAVYNTGGEGGGNFRLPDLRGRMAVGDSATLTLGASDGLVEASRTPLHTHSDGTLAAASHSHTLANHHHRHIFPIITNGANKQVVGPEDGFPDAAGLPGGSSVDAYDSYGPATQSRSVDITGQSSSTTLSRSVVTSSGPTDAAGTAANTSDTATADVAGTTGSNAASYQIVNFIIKT